MVLSKLGGKSIGESSVEVTRIAEVARVSISVFDFLSFFIHLIMRLLRDHQASRL